MTVGTPTIKVFAAFGNKPTDSSFSFNTDISADVLHLDYKRGRQMTLNVIEPGTGNITLNDSVRRYDPNNTASPYYPNVLPMKPLQVQATLAGTTYYLATHFVEGWPRVRKGPKYAERPISTVDGFDLLSLFSLAGRNYGTMFSGTLIASILNDASWPSGLRNLAAGQSAIDATGASGLGFSITDTTKALSFIQQIVGGGGENGIFFIDGRGRATFLDRHSQYGPPYNASVATFTDVLTTPGEFQYTDIRPSSDKRLIYNDWTSNWADGTSQEVINSASFLNYGRRSQTVTNLLPTKAESLSAMNYLCSIYQNPLQRVESITLKPGNNKELWIQCLSREIGDRITIKEHPPDVTALLTSTSLYTGTGILTAATAGQADIRDYTIQGIDAQFDVGPVGSATFKWSLFPANSTGMILDDLVNGQLDTGPGLGY